MNLRLSVSALGLAISLGGCTLMPDYQQPDNPVPDTVGRSDGARASVTLPGWQSLFQDSQLRALVSNALANNRDLRLALLDVRAARAQYDIQGAELLPEIDGNAEGTRQRMPADLSNAGQARTTSEYRVGLGLASYELDLFGRVRSLKASALQSYLATEEARRSAQITLVSEVASAYLTLLADHQNLRISEETVDAQQSSVDLVRNRYNAGLGSELDVRQAEIALETARTNRARYQRLVSEDRNALSVLVGAPIAVIPDTSLIDPTVSLLSRVPAGLASDALLQRPDIQQAEHALKSANANIGAARAAFYPSITLTGSAGTASSELSGLFDGGSGAWSFTPSLNLPIFTGGRNQANLKLAEIRRDQRVAEYEKTIQQAFQEVADALAARGFLSDQEASQAALVKATQRSLTLAEARYEAGADDYLAVLDARRALLSARQDLVSVRLQKLTNRVTLYRALGGGEFADQPVNLGIKRAQTEEAAPDNAG